MEEAESPSVATWSIAQVAGWVHTLDGIEDAVGLVARICDEEVDGNALMLYKDKLQVKQDLHISEAKATRLFQAIEGLRADSVASAAAVAATGGTGAAAADTGMHSVTRTPGTEAWTHAESLLQNTWVKQGVYDFVQLIGVLEIQNPRLLAQYESFKASMRDKGVTKSNELLVFHGCSSAAVTSIGHDGFQKGFQNTSTWQRFGPGFYFALQVSGCC